MENSQKIKEKIVAVEQGLRTRAQIKGQSNTSRLEDQMRRYRVPGVSIAVINNGQIEWTKEYGVISTAQSNLVRPDTLFQMGSISKAIAGFAALLLVQMGKVSLDCNINEYIKTWQIPENKLTKTEKVTLRRLLSHSAGLSVCGFLGYQNETPPSLIEILEGQKPANTPPVRVQKIPGSEWDYSGGGTTVVQLLIEEITQQPYSRWVFENIFSKLGMSASIFDLSDAKTASIASGHSAEGKPITGNWRIYPELAAAGLWSTPTDLAKFIINIQRTLFGQSEGPLSIKLVQEMLKPQIAAPGGKFSGLGVFLQGNGDEKKEAHYPTFEHNGQTEGFIARLYGFTQMGLGVAISMNAQSNGWYLMDELTHSVADVYQWPTFRPVIRAVTSVDPNIYQKFVGSFRSLKDNQGLSLMSIEVIDNKLLLKAHPDMAAMELNPESELQFFTKEGNQTVRFIASENGNINRFVFTDMNKSAFLSFVDKTDYVRIV